jgi:hypothetical protein
MANLPVASFLETGPAVLTDLVGGSRAPHAVGDDLKLTVQELADAVNILTGAGALALADKFAAYQAGGKSVTTQQIFDAVNVLTGTGALALADKLAGYQAGGKSATVQQVHDSVNVLAAAAALATADKVATTQAGVGKAATVQQVFDATNVLTAAGALATSDKIATYQAGGKSATVQQVFDATNVLTAAGALAVSDKLAAFQATGKSATVQQVLDAVDALAAAGTLVGTNTFGVIQTAAAKEATLNQLVTFLQTNLLTLNGSAFNIVGGSTSATTNGTALIAAYAAGAAATPQGAALSDTNRFTVFLLPGIFDLGASTLAMSTQFVDIVGLGRTINGITDDNTRTVGGCVVTGSGTVINKTANNAHLLNFSITTTANALATPAYTSGGTNTEEIFAFMFFDGQGGANSRGMVRAVAYPGYYFRCYNLGPDGFGCAGGAASGSFIECKSGVTSFGDAGAASGLFVNCECGSGFGSGTGGTAGGTFYNCRFNADYSSGGTFFGVTSAAGVFINCDCGSASGFGSGGTANGTFLWCRAGATSFGTVGTSTGTFKWCVGGSGSFSGAGATANGVYEYCSATDRAFGGGDSGGVASGTFRYCTATGIRSFGHRGTASGVFEYCVGGSGAFGGDEQATTGGTASGTFLGCRALDNAFGGSSATGGTASGTFLNCLGGTNCYGSGATTGGTLSGRVDNCNMTGHMRVNLTGKIENSRIEAVAANTSAVLLVSTSTGALYNCTLIGTGTGLSLDIVSGTPTVKVAHCRMNKGISVSITNAIGTPYIVDDTDII